jgi:uncharacterized membrane protein YedE/YeeE
MSVNPAHPVEAPIAVGSTPTIQGFVVAFALLAVLGLVIAVNPMGRVDLRAMAVIGFIAGIALYHASFGFTAAWRRFLRTGESAGPRAQLVMLAIACVAFYPLLARGEVAGLIVDGFIAPTGLALAVGAFLFGIGMQLGGGCGSGTLYTVGGGSLRMMVTLAAFIIGSVLATGTYAMWSIWPTLPPLSLVEQLGAPAAIAMVLALFGVLYIACLAVDRRRNGTVARLGWNGRLVTGPWPLIAGAVALALVNIATLMASGHPWGITSAFALWGGKLLQSAGLDVAAWTYWAGNPALGRPVLDDDTTVMDLALMLGALAASGLAGRFAPDPRIRLGSVAAAVLGGLLMGVGARLATGCNIGAFFSGVASGSMHGFAWILFAVPGNAVGARLRPNFGLD